MTPIIFKPLAALRGALRGPLQVDDFPSRGILKVGYFSSTIMMTARKQEKKKTDEIDKNKKDKKNKIKYR